MALYLFEGIYAVFGPDKDESAMQGIIATPSKPVLSTPQQSIFSSLITQLPPTDQATQAQNSSPSTLSTPPTPTTPRRLGPLTKRPAPRDRASSSDLDSLTTSFVSGPGAAQAMEEKDHAFRHVKAYTDANADQMKTMLAFSTIDLHDSQSQGQSPAQPAAGLVKDNPNPFFHQP
ncbi:hypothetical protein LTR78_006205 [Recurvomyces mirabilis]|uniref:Uncharacterized protein n=1 Tax=Recurvomyces mirabilis TaxID=574656 RepID=A0AAE1C0P7_9PEZI|nr:hypothetical protein LTR78_006205 [Recurvomyces mirabilis]KAK5152046.1 hypothetical protein LTS14_008820 [Recurvomyces mirabilis]